MNSSETVIRKGNIPWESEDKRRKEIHMGKAIKCVCVGGNNVKKISGREIQYIWGKTTIYYKANIEMGIHFPVWRWAVHVHGSSGKISWQWYTSRQQVILWGRSTCENFLGNCCIACNQNQFCWLKYSRKGKTLPRRSSTSAPWLYSNVPTNTKWIRKKYS